MCKGGQVSCLGETDETFVRTNDTTGNDPYTHGPVELFRPFSSQEGAVTRLNLQYPKEYSDSGVPRARERKYLGPLDGHVH